MGLERTEFQSATFTLNEPNAVYYSGQVITGNFNFELNKPLNYIAINIQYIGESNVLWTEEQIEKYNGVRQTRHIKYEGREEYFNVIHCMSGGNGGISVLRTGPHSIPFSYQLPFTAPSSFKGLKGGVSYKIIAIVLMGGYAKEEVVKNIEVIAPADLNQGGDEIKNPVKLEFEEVSSCNCFCASRPLSLTVKLPAAGFCPGQTIPISVYADNKTNLEISKIAFEITTKERYHSQQPVSAYIPPEEVLVSVKRGPILAKTSKEYMWEMKIPDFIAPNLENCRLIDVGFFFKVKIKMSGCVDSMYDEAEVWLGLVPLGATGVLQHPLRERLPRAPLPVAGGAPAASPPPPYEARVPDVQICPPGPIPYPTVANVVDESLVYGSKNRPVGPFEVGFRVPPAASMPVPGYPYPPPGPSAPPPP